jgi:hypothetical protein
LKRPAACGLHATQETKPKGNNKNRKKKKSNNKTTVNYPVIIKSHMMSVFYLWNIFVFFPKKNLRKFWNFFFNCKFNYIFLFSNMFLPNSQYHRIGKRNPIQAQKKP